MSQSADADYHVAVAVKIVSQPQSLVGYESSNLLDDGPNYWCSMDEQVTNLAFVFEAHQPCVIARFEWKGTSTPCDPARLSLEAQVDESWTELSVWDAQRSSDWQSTAILAGRRSQSQKWRLTLCHNHGHTCWMFLRAVRFLIRLAPACSMNAKLWAERAFPDVEVVVGERRFPAHRGVLAAASPVFSAMLHSEMQEAKSREIRLEGADEHSVHATLEYIYTGVLSERAEFGVALLAHKYDIDGLLEIAAPVTLRNVTEENVVETVRMLKAYAGDPKLGVMWQSLLNMVRGNGELFTAAMLAL